VIWSTILGDEEWLENLTCIEYESIIDKNMPIQRGA